MDRVLPNYVDNMTPQTPTERLATMALGEPLGDWVATRRQEGKSWDVVSAELYAASQVHVSSEWLRRLYSPRPAGGAA